MRHQIAHAEKDCYITKSTSVGMCEEKAKVPHYFMKYVALDSENFPRWERL